MKLLVKFSLIFALVFGVGLLVVGFLSYRLLQRDARTQVLNQALLMMQAASSVRDYTTSQLKPLLTPLQARDHTFLPETVPAFAATESFNYLRRKYPDYYYKEATLNPTNPRDRAVDWEADVINAFRGQPDLKTLTGVRDSATGPSLYFAQPLRAAAPCLECHSVPAAAPPAMIARYGRDNGFGWKENEIVAAQIVSIPMSVPLKMADDAFGRLLLYLLIIFGASLVVLNLVLSVTIARPVSRLSEMADKISMGQLDIPELPVKGKDEISALAGSFNRMRRSLIAAMKMIDNS